MNILQISFHTSPYSELGVNDGGGMNVYIEQISKHLSNNHNVTVVTAEKAKSFKKENLRFYSLNLFEPDLPMEDKELHLIDGRLLGRPFFYSAAWTFEDSASIIVSNIRIA